jgi:hypothetical protein
LNDSKKPQSFSLLTISLQVWDHSQLQHCGISQSLHTPESGNAAICTPSQSTSIKYPQLITVEKRFVIPAAISTGNPDSTLF